MSNINYTRYQRNMLCTLQLLHLLNKNMNFLMNITYKDTVKYIPRNNVVSRQIDNSQTVAQRQAVRSNLRGTEVDSKRNPKQ